MAFTAQIKMLIGEKSIMDYEEGVLMLGSLVRESTNGNSPDNWLKEGNVVTVNGAILFGKSENGWSGKVIP